MEHDVDYLQVYKIIDVLVLSHCVSCSLPEINSFVAVSFYWNIGRPPPPSEKNVCFTAPHININSLIF